MNRAIKPSSENNRVNEEDDPPDSLVLKSKIPTTARFQRAGLPSPLVRAVAKIKLEESLKKVGPFFVGEFKELEVISDIEKCKRLWSEFSPMKNLFDTWEFRYAFYLGYKYQPYFLLLKKRGENLALLPLWFEDKNFYDSSKKRFTWFGSDWQEEVHFFAKDINYIPILISAAPSPLYLNAIAKDSIEPIKDKIKFENDDSKYILNLENFKNHENYLMTLKKNRRRNLRKDRNRILKQKPEIIINNFADLNYLVELSKKRFQVRGEEADWQDPRRVETFKEIIKLGDRSYKKRMITIKIQKKVAGVDLVCLYNNTYFTVKCGYDVKNFSGIGNFMNLFEIDDAISLGMKKIDFLQNNYGWKSQYFKPVSLFKYEK